MTIQDSLYKAQVDIADQGMFSMTAGAARLEVIVKLLQLGYKLEDDYDALKKQHKL